MTTIKNNTFMANQFADKVAENISSYTLTEENEPCTVCMHFVNMNIINPVPKGLTSQQTRSHYVTVTGIS